MAAWHWALAAGWIAALCFFQGYLGLQRGFSSRIVLRADYLAHNPRLVDGALAPLFCMGLVNASRRRRIAGWATVAVMVALVIVVSRLPQPWRGLVDAGVAAGLVWGLVALVVFALRATRGQLPPARVRVADEVPAKPTTYAEAA
jgi:hypothetical protein